MKPEHGQGKEGGCKFTDQESPYGGRSCNGTPLLCEDQVNGIDAADPDDLLQQLGDGGNGGFFLSVIVAVDAVMYGGKRNGQGHNPKEPFASRLLQQVSAEEAGMQINDNSTQNGKRNRKSHAGIQIHAGFFFVFAGSRETGDRSLYSAAGNGEREHKYRENQLKDPESLCADGAGKKYFIKKADASADDSCESEQDGTGKKAVFQEGMFGHIDAPGDGFI